jgi:hypothetical protein
MSERTDSEGGDFDRLMSVMSVAGMKHGQAVAFIGQLINESNDLRRTEGLERALALGDELRGLGIDMPLDATLWPHARSLGIGVHCLGQATRHYLHGQSARI